MIKHARGEREMAFELAMAQADAHTTGVHVENVGRLGRARELEAEEARGGRGHGRGERRGRGRGGACWPHWPGAASLRWRWRAAGTSVWCGSCKAGAARGGRCGAGVGRNF